LTHKAVAGVVVGIEKVLLAKPRQFSLHVGDVGLSAAAIILGCSEAAGMPTN
jgi:hypothetical protein